MKNTDRKPSLTLRLAAVYNIIWGALVVLFPHLLFDLTGAERPRYPEIWQCVGMIVGVYGLGYAIASYDPVRHWPIVLVGLLGKIFGPIGFAWALVQGSFPLGFLPVIVGNDLIWWIPFSLLLWQAFRDNTRTGSEDDPIPPIAQALRETRPVGETKSLEDLSRERPLLLVFLRHSGCTFCRSTLSQLARQSDEIERSGVEVVLVTMSDPADGVKLKERFELGGARVVSDPNRTLYRSFSLPRGTWRQLFGPRVWRTGFVEAILRGHGVGQLDGDGFQMPGAFLIAEGKIVKQSTGETAADLPDFVALAKA